MAIVSQSKPSWVTNIEKQRAQSGLPTVSSGGKNTSSGSSGGTSKGISGSSTSTTGSVIKNSVSSGGTAKSTSGTSGGASSYTPAGAGSDYYAGQVMSGSDQALLKSYGDKWNAAATQAEKDYWHSKAEELRTAYGYSGGTDGSEYLNLMQQPLLNAQQNSGYDLSAYLRQIYAAQLESQLAGLKVAYEKSMAGYDDQAARLPQQYDAARNSAAAQDALARKAFDERAAASGLSSGAASQAELARSSAYQRDIANLDQAQANALSDIALQKTNLQAQYESAIAQARADGNSALATALYQELVRVQGLNREDRRLAADREAANLELALKYGLTTGTGGTGSVTAAGTSASAVGSGGTSANKQSGGKGYDNGSLTASQVKEMQAFYGLTQDGLWGPNSQKKAGSAEEAWAKYQQEKGKPENALTGNGQNMYYQLQAIPGLTMVNKVAMIEDALNNKRITDSDAEWLLNYLGY